MFVSGLGVNQDEHLIHRDVVVRALGPEADHAAQVGSLVGGGCERPQRRRDLLWLALPRGVQASLERPGKHSVLTAAAERLPAGEIVSNAAVMLFGGIETTEGMICNTVWYLLGDETALCEVTADRSLTGSAVEVFG